jgi:hypothetical protein
MIYKIIYILNFLYKYILLFSNGKILHTVINDKIILVLDENYLSKNIFIILIQPIIKIINIFLIIILSLFTKVEYIYSYSDYYYITQENSILPIIVRFEINEINYSDEICKYSSSIPIICFLMNENIIDDIIKIKIKYMVEEDDNDFYIEKNRSVDNILDTGMIYITDNIPLRLFYNIIFNKSYRINGIYNYINYDIKTNSSEFLDLDLYSYPYHSRDDLNCIESQEYYYAENYNNKLMRINNIIKS